MEQVALLDRDFLSGLGTVLALVAFIGICLWAYSSRNKTRFEEAALLPFADEETAKQDDSSGGSHLGALKTTEASQHDDK